MPGAVILNVMSKELGIPQDATEAVALLKAENLDIRKVDMDTVNGIPFLIRINLGIIADMVLQTDWKIKDYSLPPETGLNYDDAFKLVQKVKTFINPRPGQIARLRELEGYYNK